LSCHFLSFWESYSFTSACDRDIYFLLSASAFLESFASIVASFLVDTGLVSADVWFVLETLGLASVLIWVLLSDFTAVFGFSSSIFFC